MKYRDEIISMVFMEKFVEDFRLRNKLSELNAEISEKQWSQSQPFEKLLKLVMEEVL